MEFHKSEQRGMRIGQSFDVHALVAGRRLVIERHSADVPLHAVADALLGAAGAGRHLYRTGR
jgi:2C-methyl-D-erythritol 2,4-cyclodiphosphate synthase